MQVHAHPFWTMQTPVGWATKAFKNKALVKGTKAFKADPGRIKVSRLQPYASEAATLCAGGCNPATLCVRGCDAMCVKAAVAATHARVQQCPPTPYRSRG